MDFYEENLKLIKMKIPRLYDTIMHEKSIFMTNIENINDGLNCLVRKDNKKCYLHSLFDINEETNEMFKSIDKSATSLILYGLGCGHALHYLKEKHKQLNNIFVIEPSLDIFKIFLTNYRLQDELAQYDNVTFVVNQDAANTSSYLLGYINKSSTKAISACFNVSYRTLFEGYYEKISEDLAKGITKMRVNMDASIYFREQWVYNPLINLKQDAALINDLFDKFKGKSAVLVSAGPSLNKNIHLIEVAKNKAFIVAAGTASQLLDNKNIEPDLRFVMDSDPLEGKIFENHIEDKSTLVFSDRVFTDIVPMFTRKLRMIMDGDYISQYIYSKAEIKYTTVKSGFSIANTALDALIKMGFKNIILLGQDLCYTENKMYAEGSYMDEENAIENSNESRYVKTKDIFGNTVYTDIGFAGMKVLMEEQIEKSPNRNFINATEGGVGLKGATNKTFQQVLDEDIIEPFDYRTFMNDFYEKSKIESNLLKISAVIFSLEEEIDQINSINEKRLKVLKKIDRYLKNGIGLNKIDEELRYIDKFQSELNNINFYNKYIIYSMYDLFRLFNLKYKYEGQNKREALLCEKNRIQNISFELKRQLIYIKTCVKNYGSSEILD